MLKNLRNKMVCEDGSLQLDQALLIALLVLIAAATLYVLGKAVAAQFTTATGIVNDPKSLS